MEERTFQGYIFINDTEENLRVLCLENDLLCLKNWDNDLDNSSVLVLWFNTCKSLKEYIRFSIVKFVIDDDVKDLIMSDQLFGVLAEKDETTEKISIII